MSSNYTIAFQAAVSRLQARKPELIARNASVKWLASDRLFIVPFYAQTYHVHYDTGSILQADTGNRAALGTSIIIMNYLSSASNEEPIGKLVSLKEIPGGGMVFYPAFYKDVIMPLAEFTNDLQLFQKIIVQLNGKVVSRGDMAASFLALPNVEVTVVLWAGDEEVPSAATMLFDASVSGFLPVEDIIGLGYFIIHRLKKLKHLLKQESGKELFEPFWDDPTD